jgi:hypothetical protein
MLRWGNTPEATREIPAMLPRGLKMGAKLRIDDGQPFNETGRVREPLSSEDTSQYGKGLLFSPPSCLFGQKRRKSPVYITKSGENCAKKGWHRKMALLSLAPLNV